MDIASASAIITGGGSGIGAASARALTRLGARCVIVDRDEQAGKRVAEEIGGFFARADVADAEAVQAAVDAAVKIGQLRALVNAAGVGSSSRTVDRQGEPLALDAFEGDPHQPDRLLQLPSTVCRGHGKDRSGRRVGSRGAIVNLSSVAAFDGQIGQAAYSASKGGVIGHDVAYRPRPFRGRASASIRSHQGW